MRIFHQSLCSAALGIHARNRRPLLPAPCADWTLDLAVILCVDKTGFGFRMLAKMGWSEGKGLGANEDGAATHVRVKKRQDNLGSSGHNSSAHVGPSGSADQLD